REDPLNAAFLDDPAMMARVRETIPLDQVKLDDYVGVFFVGGHGTMWDFPGNPAVARVAAGIYEAGGVVAAVCHGPSALVDVRLSDGSYIVAGKEVSAFTNEEEEAVGLDKVVPFLLESKVAECRESRHLAPLETPSFTHPPLAEFGEFGTLRDDFTHGGHRWPNWERSRSWSQRTWCTKAPRSGRSPGR